MSKILPIFGVVFLAQITFIGMIHLFLVIEDKNSPETLATLSRIPVIGGFFPDPGPQETTPTPGERQDQDIRRMLASGDELFKLPREMDADEVRNHIDSASRARKNYEEMLDELKSEREALSVQKAQVNGDQQDLTAKIESLAKLEKDLEARWRELEAKQRIVAEEEAKSFSRLGEIYAKMKPDKAATVLGSMEAQEAAKIMESIEPRYQGKIFNEMTTGNQVDIQKYMLKPSFRPSDQKSDTPTGNK